MLRIQVSSASTGPSNFNFKVNPTDIDPVDSMPKLSELSVVHGAKIIQKKPYDNRIRTLTWIGHDFEDSNMSNIVDYFRSVKSEIRYFNFNDISAMNNRWPTENLDSATWKKARIVDLRVSYQDGGGFFFDEVVLYLQPEV